MVTKTKLLKPKIDVVFYSLFKIGNEEITKAIISAVTKEKIEKINLNNDRYIIGKYPEEKLGILDLRATLNDGVICNIEIQLADNKDTAERFLYYWSRIYSSQLIKGDRYEKLNKVIGIVIIDYDFEKTKEIEELSTKWKIKEVTTRAELELTDALELHIIEIPKAREILKKQPENKLAQWMLFLNDPNEEEVSEIMKNNEEIKEAMKELEEISNNEELRRVAELREKAIKDEKNVIYHARKEGKIDVARKMIEKGIEIDTICELTELTKEEVLKLK